MRRFSDGGTPPLSNVATVNITVTDCNDNAPVFTQVSYSARIREDAHVDDKILQVKKHHFFFKFFYKFFFSDYSY